jgi:hypothetical protein
LVDALKGVREAASLSREICPHSGIFYETTLSSAINISALYSLKIQDLFEYSRIMIRVRCCSTILHLSSDPTSAALASPIDLEQMTYLQRIAQSCCVGSPATVLKQSQSSFSSSPVKRRHSSFTTQQLQQQWKSEDILPLFESPLIDFMEGVEVLRELSDTTKDLRDVVSQHRLQQQQQKDRQEEEDDSSLAIGLISSLVALTKGEIAQAEFMDLIPSLRPDHHHHGRHDHNEDQSQSDHSVLLIDHLLNSLISIASVYDLNTALIPSLFQYFYQLTSSLFNTLLCVLDACLHEAIISCFETPDLLIPNLDPPPPLAATAAMGSPSHLPPTQEIGTPQLPDEVALILQQLASLREENTFIPQQLPPSHNNPDPFMTGSETDSWQNSSDAADFSSRMIQDAEAGHGSRDGGDEDWVTYYDESAARYYLYSESRGESKWLDGNES